MNGYSKIKLGGSKNSKSSPDFTDLSPPPPQSPKHVSETSPKPIPKTRLTNYSKNTYNFDLDVVNEGEIGERFGEILSRASSVSSASRRYKHEKNGNSGINSAVRRAFSMSRSSSVSEKYSRIHDQDVTIASPIDHDDENYNEGDLIMKKMMKKKSSRSAKILKACKSLFSF